MPENKMPNLENKPSIHDEGQSNEELAAKNASSEVEFQIRTIDDSNYEKKVKETNASLSHEYKKQKELILRYNEKLYNEKEKLLKDRENYRKKVKKSKNSIFSSTHQNEKIAELEEKKRNILKEIDYSSEEVKSYLAKLDNLLAVSLDDIDIKSLVDFDFLNDPSSSFKESYFNSEDYINTVTESVTSLIAKLEAETYEEATLNKIKDMNILALRNIESLVIKTYTSFNNKVASSISKMNEISASIRGIDAFFSAQSTKKEYTKYAKYLDGYLRKVEDFRDLAIKVKHASFEAELELHKQIKEIISKLKQDRYSLTPEVNVDLVTLSHNETTLLIETDKYSRLKLIYEEIRERKEDLRKVLIIEEHIRESHSKLVVTKETIEEYSKFHKKYKKLKNKLYLAEVEDSVSSYASKRLAEVRDNVLININKNLVDIKNEAEKRIQDMYQQVLETKVENSEVVFLEEAKLNKIQNTVNNYDPSIKSNYNSREDLINVINETEGKLLTPSEIKKVISYLSYLKYLEVHETEGKYFATYEANKLYSELVLETSKVLLQLEVDMDIKHLTDKYKRKDDKLLKSEEKVRSKIAYYKENQHKDTKGKKIEKFYNKLTKIQHYTNTYRDELVAKIDYVNLGRDNHLLELEYSFNKEKVRIDLLGDYASDVKEGGDVYATKMVEYNKATASLKDNSNKITSELNETIKARMNEDEATSTYYSKKKVELEEYSKAFKEGFNRTRVLKGSAVLTRRFGKNYTVKKRLIRAFVLVASFGFLGMIEFFTDFPWFNWYVGLIVGIVLAVVVELLSYFLASKHFVDIQDDGNIICYDTDGFETFFFKGNEIINHYVEVTRRPLMNIYSSKVVLTIETGSGVYEFTYVSPVNKEFCINKLVDDVLVTESKEVLDDK